MNITRIIMSSYDRVKKYRFLKKHNSEPFEEDRRLNSATSLKGFEFPTFRNVTYAQKFDDNATTDGLDGGNSKRVEEFEQVMLLGSRFSDNIPKAKSVEARSSTDSSDLGKALRIWAAQNMACLRNKTITGLLRILRSHGHEDFSTIAETLLHTQRVSTNITAMTARTGSGKYTYFGIRNQLIHRITPDTYLEEKVRTLLNIDGFPIYRDSRKQSCWPILMQVFHEKYDVRPFVVALFCGDSKPADPNELLRDFVGEASSLTTHGLVIDSKMYEFEITAIVCDTPARAFIKYAKGHGGFHACERCTVCGVTNNNRRVYAATDCSLRSHETSVQKLDPEHHIKHKESILLNIPNFDIVKSVTLDYMHLLCIGMMKNLLEKWNSGNNMSRIGLADRKTLGELLTAVEQHIPFEFQRKTMNLTELSHWKATQYRFFLLYIGGIVMEGILPKHKYKHFLLLYSACRILCSARICPDKVERARSWLISFVQLMPSLYGMDSQVINIHHLIHVADDVAHINMPLSTFSAFPFENCLGQIKRLVRTPHLPLSQICRRLSELDASKDLVIRPHPLFTGCELKQTRYETVVQSDCTEFVNMRIEQGLIGISAPDNLVQLKDDTFFRIRKTFTRSNTCRRTLNDAYVAGCKLPTRKSAFTYP